MKHAVFLLALTSCIVDVDEYAGGNPLGGRCARDEQCDPGLVCGSGLCAPAPSCADLLRRRPGTATGRYTLQIDPTGNEPPRTAFCDMTTLGGGWLLVEPESVWKRTRQHVTVVEETDARGGFSATVYANARGCGADSPFESLYVERGFAWKEIRFRETFAGQTVCYSILGGTKYVYREPPRLIPFERGVDPVLAEVKMGYDGDAFDGVTEFCESSPKHFWVRPDGLPRAIEAVLRRKETTDPGAGLGTGVSCSEFGPGTTGPTWWRYSDIYVR